MRALVTGGTGFFGKRLRDCLRRQRPRWKVFSLDRRPSSEPGHIRADLADLSQARRGLLKARPDVVFHLAGATRAQPWRELWPAHVLATAQLLEAVLSLPKSQRPKVVVAGSAHEYGSPLALPLRETDAPLPANPYGWSKLIQTQTALAYAGLGVEVVVARIFNLVGPGLPETHALSSFCRQIARTEEGGGRGILIRGNLSAGRDFVDARDACRALILLSTYGIPGEIYNVCSGHTTRLHAALTLLLGMARTPIAVRKTDAPRTRRGRRDLMRGSYAKLQARTSWRPTVSLRQSLAEMLAEWRDMARQGHHAFAARAAAQHDRRPKP